MNPYISKYISKPKIRIALTVVVLLIVVLFALRGVFIRAYVDHKIASARENYGLQIRYDKLETYGLAGIKMQGLSVVPLERDTLFSVSHLDMSFNPFKLLILQPDLRRLDADRLRLNFVKRDSTDCNFDFLFRLRSDKDSEPKERQGNYARRTERITRALFDLMPKRASISNSSITYLDRGDSVVIAIAAFEIEKQHFQTLIESIEGGHTSRWIAQGELHSAERYIAASIFSAEAGKVELPFLEYRWGARIAFDTLAISLHAERHSSQVTLDGKASVAGLTLYHKRISPDDVILDTGEIDYRVNVGQNYIEMDSATTIRFNKIEMNPYVHLEHNDKWHLRASVNKPYFAADDLFGSLPKGLFNNLEGIRTRGELSYHFLFDADLAQLDSLRLESQLKGKGFSIESFGRADLRRMSGEFTYTAYNNDMELRSFTVGASNPNFRTLESISPVLRMAVMQSEDGAFFYHNGFLIGSIRDAIIEDIRKRRFARGGSTITMQLVKNVFLNRNKTIARKVEEALIVWLIEGQHLTSKERMYEVYLNIAEWGPGIYGVREASQFYFEKEPDKIDVEEAIFLAELIPHPKRALASFDDNMQLKPHYAGYYRLLAKRLQIKGEISAERAATVMPMVTLRGAAREAILNRIEQRQIKADTLLKEEVVQ